MTAYNVVRFKVKPGREAEFVAAHQAPLPHPLAGLENASLIKTGDRTYCFVGRWGKFDDIVKARPAMIALLDSVRPMLEDLGGGLGVTDPVSGEVVANIKAK